MRIVHISSDWKWTGPAEPMLHAVTGLRERGHHVDAVFPNAPDGYEGALDARARERGVESAHALERGQGYRPWRDRRSVVALRAFLRAGRYDAVHVHHTRDHLLARAALRGAARRCLVVSWHHGDPPGRGVVRRWLYGPRANAALTVLSSELRAAVAGDLGWPCARVAVVRGSVDVERFAPRPADERVRRELGLGGDDRVVAMVARLQPHRRVELLLEALVQVRERAPGLRLLVVGRGTRAREVLDDPVSRRGLSDVVVRAGYRRGDYLDVLAQMDALVYLVPGSDGSCRAVLEAMALGKPVIATRRGVLADTVSDGETGRLIDETPESLAAALEDLWLDPGAWRARGLAGRERVAKRHAIGAAAEALEDLYARLGKQAAVER